jgi:hypothetical protein
MKKVSLFAGILIVSGLTHQISAQYEKYDAVYQRIIHEYTLHQNGTMDFRSVTDMQLLNYRAFHNLYGETFIVYHPEEQDLTINESYSILADGKKIITPANAFNEVLPRFAAHATAYNHLREMVITHTGLEIGTTIHLDYLLRTDSGFFPAFIGDELLAAEQPVKELRIIIRAPEGVKLNYEALNMELTPGITDENGFRVYTFTREDIPAMEQEENQERDNGGYPRVIFSAFPEDSKPASVFTSSPAFSMQLPAAAVTAVKKITGDYPDKVKAAFKIQELVVNDIRLFPVPEKYAGYRLRMPAEVWYSNGGTSGEKTLLMVALLREAGIAADPVPVFNEHKISQETFTLTGLESWITRADLPGAGTIYLAPDQVNAYDMAVLLPGRKMFLLHDDGTMEQIPVKQSWNEIAFNAVLAIDEQVQLSGELSGQLAGRCSPSLALLRDTSKIKSYLTGSISASDVKNVTLNDLDISGVSFSMKVNKEKALKKDTSFYIFSLPELSNGISGWGIRYLVNSRVTPFIIPYPLHETYDLTIALPRGMEMITPQKDIRIKNSSGTYRFLVESKNGTIHIIKAITVDLKKISPEDYQDLRIILNEWNDPVTREIVMKEKK